MNSNAGKLQLINFFEVQYDHTVWNSLLPIPVVLAKECPTDNARVEIFACSELPKWYVDGESDNFKTGVQLLVSNGFTKCALPFGVMMVADESVPDSSILASAKIFAEFLDQDRDGNYFRKVILK